MKSYEEFEKYVKEMNENIAKKLEDSEEEFAFYEYLVESFSSTCEKKVKLEQALNKIENILNGIGEMACYSKSMCLYEEDIEDILDIIKRTKEK